MARVTPEQLKLMQLKIDKRKKFPNKETFKYNEDAPTDSIFIPNEVKSKKNSKRLLPFRKKDGKCGCKTISSKQYLDYANTTIGYYEANCLVFAQMIKNLTPPYNIEFTFAMTTKRKFDYNNLSQGVQDLMVQAGWLEDDHYGFVKPFFGDVIVDKEKPGVYIKVLNA